MCKIHILWYDFKYYEPSLSYPLGISYILLFHLLIVSTYIDTCSALAISWLLAISRMHLILTWPQLLIRTIFLNLKKSKQTIDQMRFPLLWGAPSNTQCLNLCLYSQCHCKWLWSFCVKWLSVCMHGSLAYLFLH
jgi:hypothetical protein